MTVLLLLNANSCILLLHRLFLFQSSTLLTDNSCKIKNLKQHRKVCNCVETLRLKRVAVTSRPLQSFVYIKIVLITLRIVVVIPCKQHHFQLLRVFREALTCTRSHSPINFKFRILFQNSN